jgi:hypothetical protein
LPVRGSVHRLSAQQQTVKQRNRDSVRARFKRRGHKHTDVGRGARVVVHEVAAAVVHAHLPARRQRAEPLLAGSAPHTFQSKTKRLQTSMRWTGAVVACKKTSGSGLARTYRDARILPLRQARGVVDEVWATVRRHATLPACARASGRQCMAWQ